MTDPSWELFEHLLARFTRLQALAATLESPNPEDDLQTKLAIVGFSYSSPTESWQRAHWEFLRFYRNEELTHEVLEAHGAAAGAWEAFACLAVGGLLGRCAAGALADDALRLALLHLPGFMWLNSGAIGGEPDV